MKRGHKILVTLTAVLATAILIPVFYLAHLRAVNKAYIAQLLAHGEQMSLGPLLAPEISPAKNSAATFLSAADLLKADTSVASSNYFRAMVSIIPGKAMVCSRQPAALGFDLASGSETTNAWSELAGAMAQNRAAVDLLRQIPRQPALDFHINYLHGMGDSLAFTNLHLIEMKASGRFLAAAALIDLHNGDLNRAVAGEQSLLALIYAMKDQRFIITELVRFSMLAQAQEINWELLQTPGVTESELAGLQADWEHLNLIQDNLDALAAERVDAETDLHNWRQSASLLSGHFEIQRQWREKMGDSESPDSTWGKQTLMIQIHLWQYWWSYSDELRFLKGCQVLLGTARSLMTNEDFGTGIARQQARLEALQIKDIPDDIVSLTSSFFRQRGLHFLLSDSLGTLAGATKRLLRGEVCRQTSMAAIALQRFKLAHGNYPRQLAELVPDFVASAPCDPVDGKPLRYRLETGGTFLLYSIGENGRDDGGNPANPKDPTRNFWLDHGALDWVWPQAVTSAGSANGMTSLEK